MKLLGGPASIREAAWSRLQGALSTTWRSGRDEEEEDGVGLLSKESHSPLLSSWQTRFRGLNHRRGIACAVLGSLLLLLAVGFTSRQTSRAGEVGRLPVAVEDHYLHVIAVGQPTYSQLCKTVFTGTLLSYPVPWVSLPKDPAEGEPRPTESALDRMRSTLEILERIPETDDSAIILGNPHTWFQVRPDVLLQRYLDIQHRHRKSLLDTFGDDILSIHDVDSKVLFASNNVCESIAKDKDGCTPLKLDDGSERYLSHDFTMGPVKHLRPIYEHAVDEASKLAHVNATFDEHNVFGRLLHNQELYRQSLTDSSALKDETAHNEKEFGISLDTDEEIRYLESGRGDVPTWTTHGDDLLPADIAHSAPPYWTVFTTLPSRTWAEVPLLVHRNKVPALIQLGRTAVPSLANTWYEKLWFHPRARELFDAEALIASSPPTSLIDPKTGIKQRFWARPYDKMGVKTADEHFSPWTDVCNDTRVAEDVFLDGKGPWEDSRP